MSSEEEESGPLIVDNVENRMIEPGRICLIIWGKNYRNLLPSLILLTEPVYWLMAVKVNYHIRRVSLPMRWLQVTKFRVMISIIIIIIVIVIIIIE